MSKIDDVAPPSPDLVIESEGESCGLLEPRLWATMHSMQTGEVLEVRSDRPEARDGVRAWSWLTGNELLAMLPEKDGRTRFYLRRK